MTRQVIETSSAGGIVLNSSGEVLVVNQGGAVWSLPKGHIKSDEKILSAAKREIYEEAGITKLEFVKEFDSYQRYKMSTKGGEDKSELKTMKMFLFKTSEDNLSPTDPEITEVKWVPKEQVAELLTHQKDKEFFLSIINEI